MYYDPEHQAYVDKDTNQIIYRETDNPLDVVEGHYATIQAEEPIPDTEEFERMYELAKLHRVEQQYSQLESDLYQVHLRDYEEPGTIVDDGNNHRSDWNFARTLQALEFEMANDMMGDGDFDEKEYRASRSFRRQLMTMSFFICLVQMALLIAMIQVDGYAPRSQNSTIGPPTYTMVRFGAKESGLIVIKDEWWRLLSATMLHAGIWHYVPNAAIQVINLPLTFFIRII